MSLEDKLDRVVDRHKELESLLSEVDASDSQSYAKLSKEYSDLKPLVDKINNYFKYRKELNEVEDLLKSEDEEIKIEAISEKESLLDKKQKLEDEIKFSLIPNDSQQLSHYVQ